MKTRNFLVFYFFIKIFRFFCQILLKLPNVVLGGLFSMEKISLKRSYSKMGNYNYERGFIFNITFINYKRIET